LQLASDPTVQYEITPKPLAPPQRNPSKPTPTSIHDKTGRTALNAYDEKADSFTYLASASQEAYMVRVTNKITTGLVVVPSTAGTDEALERLQSQMAALNGAAGGGRVIIERTTVDPELAKKKAEEAEKQKLKAQRKLEVQQTKMRDQTSRVFARGGARGAGGLTIGDLEDGGGRRAPRKKPRRSRLEDLDSEEEYGGNGHTAREDHYDEEDDFIAASDEDEDLDAEGEDDDDMDAMIESREKEQRERERERERMGTPKRDRAPANEDEDEAPGTHGSPVRTKRRKVVEDDEDEE
jgi:RNA polymerase-associated protein LEO1